MSGRDYTSKRYQILEALKTKLELINGMGTFLTDVSKNVHTKLLFWDEVDSFPAIHMNAGSETRENLAGGVKNRFLSITLRVYVKNFENAQKNLDELIEDIETVIEDNSVLSYVNRSTPPVTQYTQDILIQSIETDEGVLDPLGVGEVLVLVRY